MCKADRRRVILFAALASLMVTFAATPGTAAPDPSGAAAIFALAHTLCTRDNGALWGRTLCGPMIIVDYKDRRLAANEADGGRFEPIGAVYVGTLPDAAILAETPIELSGRRWTELIWPLNVDGAALKVKLAHELFHRIQPQLGLTRPELPNTQLDSLQGRLLVQLEWRALAAALTAPDEALRRRAINDAVLFRAARYAATPKARETESDLEYNEGLAEYTGVRLGLETAASRRAFALRDLSQYLASPTFVRVFAFASGPAYGLLLDHYQPSWRTRLASGPGLGERLAAAMKLAPPDLSTLDAREAVYDPDGALMRSETVRAKAITAHLAELRAKLVSGPVLVLTLHHAQFQFNPQTLEALDPYGAVYPTFHVTGAWGVLDVTADALVSPDMDDVRVALKGAAPSHDKGLGWTLNLKPGWTLTPGARAGDLEAKAPS